MKTVVDLGDRSYTIAIADSYQQLPAQLKLLQLPTHGWVISHQRLLTQHGASFLVPLRRAGWTLETLTVPESESSKSFAMVERLIRQLSRKATMRVPVLFAFGGGVVGDLTGFVAAVFRRGIPYVQIPTTLLAQVDSAIGGKVGVDLPQAKNFVGAFYQPRLVYNNIRVLQTLPLRQRRSGFAEVIKYGAIADRTLFRLLEERLLACLAFEHSVTQEMVKRSCQMKAWYVSRDERETRGERAHLNFGHTLGHALEAATHYRRWTHGEAIAIGMCAAAALSAEMGLCSAGECERVVRLIRASGLPTHATEIERQRVLQALPYDKKFIHGRQRWVLLKRIGKVVVTETVPEALARRVISRYVG